jgi:hypothetical protein
VTVFRFQVLSAEATQLAFKPAADCVSYTDGRCETVPAACCNPNDNPPCTVCSFARTRVVGGPYPGGDATGALGGPATVEISDCPEPTVVTEGCRYLGVTPTEGPESVALYVTGVDTEVACVEGYVQSDGKLGSVSSPFYQSPAAWGSVHVRGADIMPGMTYNVQADCSPADPGSSLSGPAGDTLFAWGDANNSAGGVVDFTDITLVVDGFQGRYHALNRPCGTDAECADVAGSYHETCDTVEGLCIRTTLENVDLIGAQYPDLAGCSPDRLIDFTDITFVVNAFQAKAYPIQCRPCP